MQHYLPQDVNLSQIMTLHKTLQRNDNVELCEPMIITLSIRPRFETRLKELLAGAEAGHGLSHYLSRDGTPFSEQTLHPEFPQDEDIADDDTHEPAVGAGDELTALEESALSAGDAENDIDNHEDDINDEHGELDIAETGPSNTEDNTATDHKSPNVELTGVELERQISEDGAVANGIYEEPNEEDGHQEDDQDQEGEAKYDEEQDETQEKDVKGLGSEEGSGSTENNHDSTLVDDAKTGASTGVVDFAVHGNADTTSKVQQQDVLHDEVEAIGADGHKNLATTNGDILEDELTELHEESFDAELEQGGLNEDSEAAIEDSSLDAMGHEDEEASGRDHEGPPAEHETPAVKSQPSTPLIDGNGDDGPPVEDVDEIDEIDYDEDDDDVTIAGDASQTTTPPTNGSIKRSRVDEDDLGDQNDAPNKGKQSLSI